MSQKKNKKRHSQSTINAKRQAAQEQLADEKDRSRKRINPAGRNLLLGNLVFLALCQWLHQLNLLPKQLYDLSGIIGVVLLLIALWLLFGKKRPEGSGGPHIPGGPTLPR